MKVAISLLTLLFVSNLSMAQTYVSGSITSNTTWNLDGSPFVVTANVTLNSGITLTINPGVVVKFNAGVQLTVYGNLQAIGTVSDSIVFTSLKDDNYGGDTNGDSTATYPAPGDWQRIEYYNSGSSTSVLRYCSVLYGGSGSGGNIRCYGYTSQANPTIENNRIARSSNQGIYIYYSSPKIGGNTIAYNTNGYPIYLAGTCSPNYTSANSFLKNLRQAVGVAGGTLSSFTWTNPGYAYVLTSNTTLNSSQTGTLSPGVVVKFNAGVQLTVYGNLQAIGTVSDSIVFTSLKDDNYGGDTNGDSTATSPTPGDWDRIEFYNGGSSTSVLRYCPVLYGGSGSGGNIRCYGYTSQANPTIENNRIARSSNQGIYIYYSSPKIGGNTIAYNTNGYPIYLAGTCSPNYTSANSFLKNLRQAVGVAGGTLSSFTWTNPGYAYVLTSNTTLNSSQTGTLSPGVVVKFNAGVQLTVYGNLQAIGTVSDSIVFTSLKDDNYGGDTNGDSTATYPAPGDWDRIEFYNGGSSTSVLRYCPVLYGGSGSGGNIRCYGYTSQANPTIENNRIARSSNQGIYIYYSSPKIGGNTIAYNTNGYPIYLAGTCSPNYTSANSFLKNLRQAVGVAGGTLSSFTWTNPGYAYVLTSNTTLNSSQTGTLSPGVVVKFNAGVQLTVYGNLQAIGTVSDSIVFTSLKDDNYGGDTNGDSTATYPAPGDWDRIEFYNGGSSTSVLRYCPVLYGGSGSGGNIRCYGYTSQANPTIENNRISYGSNKGLQCQGSNPSLNLNSITNNATYGLYNSTSAITVNAEFIWWGDSTGPYHPVLNPLGYGNAVSDYVDFIPWIGMSGASYSPLLLSPTNGSTQVTLTPTLQWKAFPGALTYRLQVATDSVFSAIVFDDSSITTLSRQVGPLLLATKYFWRVNAKDSTSTSNWSRVWSFTTIQDFMEFGTWQHFNVSPGSPFTQTIQVQAIDRLYVLMKKATTIGYSGTWNGSMKILCNGVQVGYVSGYSDFEFQKQLPDTGVYDIEIQSSQAGEGYIRFSSSLDTLNLAQWDLGTIYRPYGYDWKQFDVGSGQDTLFLQTEGYGLWSTLDVYYATLGNNSNHWIFSNWGAGYQIKGKIIHPLAGRYFLRYMDSAVLYGDTTQTRQYMVYAGTTPVPQPPAVAPIISSLSTDRGGTSGPVTVTISGVGLDTASMVSLVREGFPDITARFVHGEPTFRSLRATFVLSGATPGDWRLKVQTPNGDSTFAMNFFTIETGGAPDLWIEIVGRQTIRIERNQRYVIRFGNHGSIDAISVPLGIGGIPSQFSYQLLTSLYRPSGHPSVAGIPFDLDTIHVQLHIEKNNELQIPLLLSCIPPGYTGTIELLLEASNPQTFTLRSWLNPPWITGYPVWSSEGSIRILPNDGGDCVASIVGLALDSWGIWTGASCVSNLTSLYNPMDHNFMLMTYDAARTTDATSRTWWAFATLAKTALACGSVVPGYGQIAGAALLLWDFYDVASDCELEHSRIAQSDLDVHTVNSMTPEDKFGPTGYDPPDTSIVILQRFVKSNEHLAYRIDFWNKEDATAPAQEVFIRDTLSENFNLSNFNFTQLGFLRWTVQLQGGQYFNTNVDMRPDMNLIVNVEGILNQSARTISWTFRSLDPATMQLPEDPMLGFLPPMDSTGYNIGWVDYSVRPINGLQSGTEVINQAFVNFDGVGPWNPAPNAAPFLNTIDAGPPISSVLPISTSGIVDSFIVSWSGKDDSLGCGIAKYTIYVSENDNGYQAWLTNTADTSAIFNGIDGYNYKFFSIAKDNTDNTENWKTEPEAEVTVGDVTIRLSPSWNLISWNKITESDSIRIVLANILDNLEVALGFDSLGLTFDPEIEDIYNNLLTVNNKSGYWLKMNAEDYLFFDGERIDPQTPLRLRTGWNLISYLPAYSDSIRHALASIIDKILIVQAFDGNALTFNPSLADSINTLNIMSPNYGYWVKMSAADTLTYSIPPFQNKYLSTRLAVVNELPELDSLVKPTNEWISIYATQINVNNVPLPIGTVVTFEDSSGIICGKGLVNKAGTFPLIAVFRDDATTPNIDEGAEPGDRIKVFFNDLRVPIEVSWLRNGQIENLSDLITNVKGNMDGLIPTKFDISQNYPNPFNPTTTIKYQVPKVEKVTIEVYNILGERVKTLVNELLEPGYYEIKWNSINDNNHQVASGVYIYRMRAGDFVRSKKMIILK